MEPVLKSNNALEPTNIKLPEKTIVRSPKESVTLSENDYNNYKQYIPQIKANTNLDYLRAINQSTGEQLAVGFTNMIANIPIKLVEDVGYLSDLFGDRNFDNDIIKYAKNSINPAGEVYQENPSNGFDFSDPASYINSISQLGTSIGEFAVLAPTIGGAIGKVTSQLPKAFAYLSAGAKTVDTLTKSAKLVQTLGTALATGYLEGAQTASTKHDQYFNDLYKTNLNVNNLKKSRNEEALTDEELNNLTEQQTVQAMRDIATVNMLLTAPLNITGVKAIFQSEQRMLQQNIAKQMFKAKPVGMKTLDYLDEISKVNPTIKTMPMYKRAGLETLQEGFEEGIVNPLAENVGDKEALINPELLTNQIFSKEGAVSTVLGMIGGGGQTLVTQAVPRYRKRDEKGNKIGSWWNRESVNAIKVRREIQAVKNVQENYLKDVTSIKDILTKLPTATKEEQKILKQDLFNIITKNTIEYGNSDLLNTIYSSIAELDNSETVETKSVTKPDGTVENIEYTEAMKAGFAFDKNDNEYVTTAQKAKVQLEELVKIYNDDYAKYNTIEQMVKDSNIVNILFRLKAISYLAPDQIMEMEQAYSTILNDVQKTNPDFNRNLVETLVKQKAIFALNAQLENELLNDTTDLQNNIRVGEIKEKWNLTENTNDKLIAELNKSYEIRRNNYNKEYNEYNKIISSDFEKYYNAEAKDEFEKIATEHNINFKKLRRKSLQLFNKSNKVKNLADTYNSLSNKSSLRAKKVKEQFDKRNEELNKLIEERDNLTSLLTESQKELSSHEQKYYDKYIQKQIVDNDINTNLSQIQQVITNKKNQLKEANELINKMDNMKYVKSFVEKWRKDIDNFIDKTEAQQYKEFITKLSEIKSDKSYFFLRELEELGKEYPAYKHIINSYIDSKATDLLTDMDYLNMVSKINKQELLDEFDKNITSLKIEKQPIKDTNKIENDNTKDIDDKILKGVYRVLRSDLIADLKKYQVTLNSLLAILPDSLKEKFKEYDTVLNKLQSNETEEEFLNTVNYSFIFLNTLTSKLAENNPDNVAVLNVIKDTYTKYIKHTNEIKKYRKDLEVLNQINTLFTAKLSTLNSILKDITDTDNNEDTDIDKGNNDDKVESFQRIGEKIIDGSVSVAYLNFDAEKVKISDDTYLYVTPKQKKSFIPQYSMQHLQPNDELRFSFDKADIKLKKDGKETLQSFSSVSNNKDLIPIKIESKINGEWVKIGYVHTTDWIKEMGSKNKANNVADKIRVGEHIIDNYSIQVEEIEALRNNLFNILNKNEFVYSNITSKDNGFIAFNKLKEVVNNKAVLEYTNLNTHITDDMPVFLSILINGNLYSNKNEIFNINNYIIDKLQNKKNKTENDNYLLNQAIAGKLEIKSKMTDNMIAQFNGNPVLVIPTSIKNVFDFIILRNDKAGKTTIKDKPFSEIISNLFEYYLNNDLTNNPNITDQNIFNILTKYVQIPTDTKVFFKTSETGEKYISYTIQPNEDVFKRVIIKKDSIQVYTNDSKTAKVDIKINGNFNEQFNSVLLAEINSLNISTSLSNINNKELNVPIVNKIKDNNYTVDVLKTGFDFYSNVLKSPLNEPTKSETGEYGFYEHPNILFNNNFRTDTKIINDIPNIGEPTNKTNSKTLSDGKEKNQEKRLLKTDELTDDEADMFLSPTIAFDNKDSAYSRKEKYDNRELVNILFESEQFINWYGKPLDISENNLILTNIKGETFDFNDFISNGSLPFEITRERIASSISVNELNEYTKNCKLK